MVLKSRKEVIEFDFLNCVVTLSSSTCFLRILFGRPLFFRPLTLNSKAFLITTQLIDFSPTKLRSVKSKRCQCNK